MSEFSGKSCRKAFEESGLSYNDLTYADLEVLHASVSKCLDVAVENGQTTVDELRLAKKIKVDYDADGKIVDAFLRINGSYFEHREAISFNEDGFIGFCGWADSHNALPIYQGFIIWLRSLTGVVRTVCSNGITCHFSCSLCGNAVDESDRYCKHCGVSLAGGHE